MRHSYTSISLFLKCPQRYKAQYIERRVPRTTSPALERGIAMHATLEADLKAKAPKPTLWVDPTVWETLLQAGAQAEVEVKTATLTAKIDVLVLRKNYALSLDHKSGKSEGDPLQFDIQAALLHEVHGVETVDGIFSYVDRRETSRPYRVTATARDSVDALVHRVENEKTFHAKPGFYCTGCPLTECRYSKPARYKS